ncbi:hypothetical protein E2C01_064510 [Portunus trituberculatus]|uniref:Uncharacterized protein n=1 Tax=Portunus trituberculatus TaxID=210409 RepID=A0A5B7HNF0_PORTR|nr:hypothetical protein [Portunus trituberculatus]
MSRGPTQRRGGGCSFCFCIRKPSVESYSYRRQPTPLLLKREVSKCNVLLQERHSQTHTCHTSTIFKTYNRKDTETQIPEKK